MCRTFFGVVVLASLISGCAESGRAGACDPKFSSCTDSGVGGGGTPDLSANAVDAGEVLDFASIADLTPPKKFGEPCTDRAQCESGICVFSGLGGVCTQLCPTIGCPQGYGCYGVLGGGIDPGQVADICVPENNLLCSPCTKSSECGSPSGGDQCLPYPTGTFCGRDCSTIACPPTYTCQTFTGDGGTSKQCVPVNNSCDCSAANAGITVACSISTPAGSTCGGTRKCNGAQGWSSCTPPATSDAPDATYKDDNCDGIDGDVTRAIFVDQLNGADSNPGTMAMPVASLEKGIALANGATKKDVYVSKGSYLPTGPLKLASGVSLYGRYDAAHGWSRADANQTIIEGDITAVLADGLNAETHLEGFVILAQDGAASGESSYGVRVNGGGGHIFIRYNSIAAGAGAQGGDGSDGADGPDVTDSGQKGPDGCSAQSCSNGGARGGNSPCGRTGGSGGSGGYKDGGGISGNPGTGWGGGAGLPSAGGAAGGSHACTIPGSGGNGGEPGKPGGPGSSGNNVTPSTNIGGVAGGGVYAPAPGTDGNPGKDGDGGGGGGGGGGGAQACLFVCVCDADTGGAGGGGGGGGCHGTVGTAGGGGGGSFAVFVAGGTVSVDGNTLLTRRGGRGGKGGRGGEGSSGGQPGGSSSNADDAGGGGGGGAGGKGGAAGAGSGGPGGPSVAVVSAAGAAVDIGTTNNYTLGQGGVGGAGGGSSSLGQAPTGVAGASQPSLTF
jgi:hypothetical protein